MTVTTGAETFSVFGTTATLLVSQAGAAAAARAIADAELAAIDRACSRFRPDSELSRLNAAGGRPLDISPLFAELIEVALRAAELSSGAVDPTCGQALADLGYDRDIAAVRAASPGPPGTGSHGTGPHGTGPHGTGSHGAEAGEAGQGIGPRGLGRPVPGWRSVRLDRARGSARLRRGAQLDLGSTGKAWAADRCATLIAARTGSGVLVSLGGDIAVAGGPPGDGWRIRVTDDHAAGPDAAGQTVTIKAGGLATSSTTVRTWTAGGRRMHHIVDPATGQPARSCWRTVSVAAGSCVDANTASTAAIIKAEAAPAWLESAGLPARLVRTDGSVTVVTGWPGQPADPA